MTEKDHAHLMRDIRGYVEILDNSTNPKLDSLKFFIQSTYLDAKGESRANFQITKKGCDMVANKMTGEKGVLFTATYVTKFEEMENPAPKTQVINSSFLFQIAGQLEKVEKENQFLLTENKVKDQIIGELKPKADYTDAILQNKGLVTMTQISKDYGMSANEMNGLLHDLKIQFKQSNQWLLYREHQNNGYTHSQTIDIIRKDGSPDITMNTKWTQKGRLFIYNTLKDRKEIIPVIEREYPKK